MDRLNYHASDRKAFDSIDRSTDRSIPTRHWHTHTLCFFSFGGVMLATGERRSLSWD